MGWYGSAYLLTSGTLQPLFGRIYTCFPKHYVLMVALILFEIGSIVSAVATSSRIFILGRALQGSGYAGIFMYVSRSEPVLLTSLTSPSCAAASSPSARRSCP